MQREGEPRVSLVVLFCGSPRRGWPQENGLHCEGSFWVRCPETFCLTPWKWGACLELGSLCRSQEEVAPSTSRSCCGGLRGATHDPQAWDGRGADSCGSPGQLGRSQPCSCCWEGGARGQEGAGDLASVSASRWAPACSQSLSVLPWASPQPLPETGAPRRRGLESLAHASPPSRARSSTQA